MIVLAPVIAVGLSWLCFLAGEKIEPRMSRAMSILIWLLVLLGIVPLAFLAVIFEGFLEFLAVVALGVFWLVGFSSLMRAIIPAWRPGIRL